MGRQAATILIVLLAAFSMPAHAADRTPVLIELFSSEGCSSCPPADDLLAALLREQPVVGARLVGLAEHVDYWDYLGWKDVFARPEFTARQKAVAGQQGLYTPMMVVDGQEAFVGHDRAKAIAAITAAAARPHARLVLTATQLVVQSLPPGWAGRLLAVEVTSPRRTATSHVTRGENAGHDLAHVELAGAIQRFPIDARKLPITLPLPAATHRTAVLRALDGTAVLGSATI
ncbi:MAG: hypothetical protein JWM80_2479 [Cyanobacteria bacterium RYN_339]|nr:hypothetical protein [Cyanobacteria bacterium RYN_339]